MKTSFEKKQLTLLSTSQAYLSREEQFAFCSTAGAKFVSLYNFWSPYLSLYSALSNGQGSWHQAAHVLDFSWFGGERLQLRTLAHRWRQELEVPAVFVKSNLLSSRINPHQPPMNYGNQKLNGLSQLHWAKASSLCCGPAVYSILSLKAKVPNIGVSWGKDLEIIDLNSPNHQSSWIWMNVITSIW